MDYTHKDDAVGKFTQFGAPAIGKQFTVKHNGSSDGIYAYVGLAGHMLGTFQGMFHTGARPIRSRTRGNYKTSKKVTTIRR